MHRYVTLVVDFAHIAAGQHFVVAGSEFYLGVRMEWGGVGLLGEFVDGFLGGA